MLDMNRNVVGLFYGGGKQLIAPPGTDDARAVACRIENVMSQLAITIPPGTAAPVTVPSSNKPSPSPRPGDQVSAAEVAQRTAAQALYEELVRTDAGRRHLGLIRRHQEELVELVNHNRRMAATWRRWAGPAILAEIFKCMEDRQRVVSNIVNDVSLNEGTGRIIDMLERQGSLQLRSDLSRYRAIRSGLSGMTFDTMLEALGVHADGG